MKRNWDSATLLLVALTALALYLSYVIFRPFAGAILFAMVIAIIFHPVHRHSRHLFRGRNSAALVSTLLATLLTAIPLFLIGFAVSSELVDLYHSVSARSGANGGVFGQAVNAIERLVSWAAQRFGFPALDVHSMIMERLGEASAALVHFGAGVARNLFSILLNAVIAVVVLFFLFRDGEANLSRLSSVLPMSQERFLELRSRVSATVIANFYGGVAVGAAQGTLTALAFWALGIQSPVLWGVVTGLFSLVPVTGSASVWLPASIILAFTGHLTKGIILLAWGAGVVGTVDNIIRPWIISGRVQLRTIYVFFALLGGVQAFGIVGFFVGPVILSVTVALLGMLKEDLATHTSTPGQGELLEKDRIPQTRGGGVAGQLRNQKW